jgi:hypothetical protein
MISAELRRIGLAVVVVHAVISLIHGAAHNKLLILMSAWQNVYILVVIFTLPLVAGVLLWRRSRKASFVLLLSMVGSFLFGGYYHFILPGPDNVGHLMDHAWKVPFQVSAVLLAIVEAVGVVVGWMGMNSKTSN